jgi:hypothetical protein
MEAQRLKEGKRSAEDALGKAVVEGEKTRVGEAEDCLAGGGLLRRTVGYGLLDMGS